jgi:hypothetical protein
MHAQHSRSAWAGGCHMPRPRNVPALVPQQAGAGADGAAGQQHTPSRVQIRLQAVRKELPIFPLNVVALPCSPLPLMIFEAR